MASSVLAPRSLGEAGAEPVPGYRLVERLGVGGAGEVWCAEGPGGLPVALKLVRLSCKLGDRELDNLRILRAVRHPNLLAYFGAWTTDDLLIIGMELAECSLWDHFNRRSAKRLAGIPLSELLAIMGEVAKLVDFLHEPRHELDGKLHVAIHHGDIKPQNIMLLGGGVKVADFGLSCLYDQYAKIRTQDGLTYPYAAPEMFRRQVSDHSDQYSLAVTYCVLRGGRLPFVGPPASVMYGHLFEPPDLSMLPVPEQPIVHRALAKDAAERWPNCRQFIEALCSCPDAGSPETIPGDDDRDENEHATGRYQRAGLPGDSSSETSTGYVINSSAADDRSSYQLGSLTVTPVASSISHQSQSRTVVIPADRPERARPHSRSTLIRGSIGFLVLLGVGSWAMLAREVPTKGLAVMRFNGQVIAPGSTHRDQPAAGEVSSLDPPASVLSSAAPPLDPIFAAAGPTLHTSAARACRPDQALPVLDESADETDTEAGPELRSGGLVYDRSPELKAQSLRLIRLVTMALGKLRAQAVRALQVVSAAHARAVPRPPAAQPPPAALSLVPDRQQSAKATLRIVLPDTIEIQAGWSKDVPVAADRGGVEGPVFVQLEGLPKGVMSPPVIIPARVNRSVACVRAQIEARSVELTLRVTARRGSQQTEQPITLIVHANPSLTYRTQGHRLLAGGKPAEAIGAFSRALEIAPGDPIVLNNRGVAHAMLGQLQSAVADCTAAIRLSPRNSLIRYNRGIAYALQGNMTRAALDFDTAIRLRPNYAPAYCSRAE